MYKFISVFCFVCIASVSQAQLIADTSKAGLDAQCDKIMQTFAQAKFSEAVQLLKQRSTLGASFVDNLDKSMNEQMSNVVQNYKKITGYELINEKTINNVLSRRRYLLKFEVYFLSFDFYMYNNGSGWLISGFYYNDDQKVLF
jgi:hypothetical protein